MLGARRCLVALTIALLTVPLAADELHLELDPSKTVVSFSLDSTLHEVHGTIPMTAGTIVFQSGGGAASGEITLDARRAETGNAKRDKKMHREVLESNTHGSVRFVPSRTEGTLPSSGRATLKIHGTIHIHGGSHPSTIEAEVVRTGDQLTATGTLSIPFVEWGMKDPSIFVLRTDKVVAVEIEVVGRLGQPPPTS